MKSNPFPTSINKAIFQNLLSIIPTESYSKHLEGIILGLIDALLRGEIELSLDKGIVPDGLQANEWPDLYLDALLSSGWLGDELSPIVLKGNSISFKRWEFDTDKLLNDLLERAKRNKKHFNHENKN